MCEHGRRRTLCRHVRNHLYGSGGQRFAWQLVEIVAVEVGEGKGKVTKAVWSARGAQLSKRDMRFLSEDIIDVWSLGAFVNSDPMKACASIREELRVAIRLGIKVSYDSTLRRCAEMIQRRGPSFHEPMRSCTFLKFGGRPKHVASNSRACCEARASPCGLLSSLAVGCGWPAAAPWGSLAWGKRGMAPHQLTKRTSHSAFFFQQQPGHCIGGGRLRLWTRGRNCTRRAC
eukprot:COSAG03_NODE_2131_length_3093_cov_2.777889_2_plen_230_part_00